METTTLQAEVRAERGKGPARRLRASGKVPGVFYGPGTEPTPLTLSPDELTQALLGERGRNVVFKLRIEGKEELAMVKDLTTDPVTRALLHVDLYRMSEDTQLEVKVPFHVHGRPVGVVQGGVLNVTRRDLPLSTKPASIPVSIDVDATPLNIGDHITVKDLQLPEGVACTLRPELTLVTVLEARQTATDEDEAEDATAPAAGGAEDAADKG